MPVSRLRAWTSACAASSTATTPPRPFELAACSAVDPLRLVALTRAPAATLCRPVGRVQARLKPCELSGQGLAMKGGKGCGGGRDKRELNWVLFKQRRLPLLSTTQDLIAGGFGRQALVSWELTSALTTSAKPEASHPEGRRLFGTAAVGRGAGHQQALDLGKLAPSTVHEQPCSRDVPGIVVHGH